jgi:hypothetical protein
MPRYLVQETHFAGYYHNPFKPNRKGNKRSKWLTVDSVETLGQAEAQWEAFQANRNQGQLQHYRVTYNGKVIISERGVEYEPVTDETGTWMRYVKQLAGGVEP